VCEKESAGTNESSLQKWISGLPRTQSPSANLTTSSFKSTDKAFYDMPYKVYYSGQASQTVPFVDPSSAPLSILSQLLTHNYLHPEIREKGGAYGAGASNGPIKGIFTFMSYRDPNPLNSLKVFKNSGIFARDRAWSEREIEEAKLGIFQGLDAPMSVDDEGARYFMSGVTHEMDQRWREQLLDVTAKDVNAVADEFLVNGSRQTTCVLGEKKDWTDSEWELRKLSMDAAA
jgi:Zn-dependent M16 (insulinase) family peptidase